VIPTGGEDGAGDIYRAGKLSVHVEIQPPAPEVLPKVVLDAAQRGVDNNTLWDGDTRKCALQLEGGRGFLGGNRIRVGAPRVGAVRGG